MNLYVISLNDSNGRLQSFGTVASTKIKAEKEACKLAGVPEGTETHTSQNLHRVDATAA